MTGDIKLRYPLDTVVAIRRIVASGGAATINAGEPTKQGTAGAVAIMADGDGTTSQLFTGVAKSTSTDTAAAAGEVYTYLPLPGITYEAKAKSATAADTQAEIDALQGKRVVFDLTSTVWTVDTAAADNAANGVVIVGGDPNSNTVFFIVKTAVSLFGE